MTSISEIFASILKARVLVVGDVMLDCFVSGKVERISPEAPVPVLKPHSKTHLAGGAANVARNLAHLGAHTELIGVIGNEEVAKSLTQTLADEPNIAFRPIKVNNRKTTIKTRFSASAQQILRLDEEANEPLNAKTNSLIINTAQKALKNADILILSDYGKGVISEETAKRLIKLAKSAGVKVLVDPKKHDPSCFNGADLMTPNLAELANMTAQPHLDIDSVAQIAESMRKAHNITHILTTLGADGMLLSGKGIKTSRIDSVAREVFDVSGAGDTSIAMLGAAIAAGADIETATHLANRAAGLVVSKWGTAALTSGEILAEFAPPTNTDEATLMKRMKQWQQKDLSVGFTNGCFDCLHAGHIWLLTKAAEHCDKLIVGLNADASVKKLKGANRPLQSQATRAAVLASLPMVDAVVIFGEPTPAKLIEKITPHRLIKGGDYKAVEVIGSKFVKASGGKTVIIPLLKGYSTSRLYLGRR